MPGVVRVVSIDPARIRTSLELAEQLAVLFDRDPRGQERFAHDAGLGVGTVQQSAGQSVVVFLQVGGGLRSLWRPGGRRTGRRAWRRST
ncbi:hypothetical protein GCM10010182_00740 [Actinomadura cremea]|nr:hypothetical protein GCM10010182_00740 [Actinomadura cremea]